MSVDRYHGTRTGDYPVEPVNHEEAPQAPQEYADAPQDQGETYQIPEPRDDTQELINRTAERIREGDIPEKQSRIKRVVALGAAGATLVAGVIGGVTYAKDKMDATPADTAEPTVSAPIVTGPSETSTAEKEPLTSETVPFTVDGKMYVGVMTDNGIVANFGVFRQNDPKLPAPTKKEASDIMARYANAVQVFNNMMVSDEVKPFRDEAMDKALFKPGTSGALETFVKQNQENGTKIVAVEPFTDPTSLKSGGVDTIQSGFYATTDKGERFRIDAALVNNFGAMVNEGTSFITSSTRK